MNINDYSTGINMQFYYGGLIFVNDYRFNRLIILYNWYQGRVVDTSTAIHPLFYDEGKNENFKLVNQFFLSLN